MNWIQKKEAIVNNILAHQELRKALFYNDSNFLDKPDISASQLLYHNVFPYQHPIDSTTSPASYLTVSFKNMKLVNSTFSSGLLYIHTLVHKDLMKTDYGALRTDYIISLIDELMNGQTGLGMGKLEFNRMDELALKSGYIDLYVSYKIWDFY
ncbi:MULTISPECIES: hypothetical protein [unclassified Paenibacillus]|uniref:hypothetical protein n=1 Tax=unclassified Paenibacillus TaxID=185978 RepID=UPI001EF508E8|nr:MULTISPECIES: hypothetical protein [unclassified Paenibacillus]